MTTAGCGFLSPKPASVLSSDAETARRPADVIAVAAIFEDLKLLPERDVYVKIRIDRFSVELRMRRNKHHIFLCQLTHR